MPSTPVPVTAEGMPKFDRSQIMKAAWTIYLHMTRTIRTSTVAGRCKWFANALRGAWEQAKQAAAEAVITASQRAARVEALKAEILTLDCKPFGIRIGAERAAAIITEIEALAEASNQEAA